MAFCSYKICQNFDYFLFEWYHSAKFRELILEKVSWRKTKRLRHSACIKFVRILIIFCSNDIILQNIGSSLLKRLVEEKPKIVAFCSYQICQNFDYFLFEWYHSVLYRGFIFENASQRKAKKVQQSARIKIVWIKWYSSLLFKELISEKR